MFSLILTLGIAVGYALGYKNDRTLKQQIFKLKTTIKKNSKSAQLKELSIAELKERDDWDFRDRLAQVTGQSVLAPDQERNDDPNAMSNMFQ